MKESCLQFGPEARLSGILSEPDWGRSLGLVLISAGLTPKPGPFRLYTELARRLTDEGVTTLRFDLGGIGDSNAGYPGQPLAARSELEIRAALDEVAKEQTSGGLVLAGLCSGAEDAVRAAAGDPRVTSVVLIDPFAYRAPGFSWRHGLYRAKRRLLRALGVYQPLAKSVAPRAVSYEYMARAESTRLLRALLARDVHLHFVYTGGMREKLNHPAQLAAAFPDLDFRDHVTIDYFPHMDHTAPLAADRRELIEVVARRLRDDSSATRWN